MICDKQCNFRQLELSATQKIKAEIIHRLLRRHLDKYLNETIVLTLLIPGGRKFQVEKIANTRTYLTYSRNIKTSVATMNKQD